MRKILLSILTLVYMTASAGVVVDIHYCMGKETGIDLYKSADGDKCGKCGMAGNTGCCKDDHRFYKMESGFKTVPQSFNFTFPYQEISLPYFDFQMPVLVSTGKSLPPINSPPRKLPPIFLLNCNFRI